MSRRDLRPGGVFGRSLHLGESNSRAVALDASEDAELVSRVLAGDSDCFSVLYRRYTPVVRMAIRDHVYDTEDQLDLIQDTFARAFQRLRSLNEPASFRPWLLQIARHCAIDHRRRVSRQQLVSIDALERPSLATTDPSPVDLAELTDMARRVRRGFARLSRRDATAVALVTHLGFGPNELAEALGVTETNAKVILHRARKRLKAAIDLESAVIGDGP